MRESRSDRTLLRDDNNQILGFALGFDFCAEHETTTKTLDQMLGIDHTRLGIGGRSMNISIDACNLVMGHTRKRRSKIAPNGERLMWVAQDASERGETLKAGKTPYDHPSHYFRDEDGQRFTAAWDERGFAIRAFGKEEIKALDDVIAAFEAGDITISRGRSAPFGGSGLNIIITSRLSEEVKKQVLDQDIAHLELCMADLDTGIRERLQKSKRGYYALSPKPASFFTSVGERKRPIAEETCEKVVYFLNPHEQSLYNSGWFTVEDLDAWIRGEGPIVKK